MFLTIENLEILTGYKNPSKQIEWLKHAGIRFTVNRYGHPLILQKHIEYMLGAPAEGKQARVEPNKKALQDASKKKIEARTSHG